MEMMIGEVRQISWIIAFLGRSVVSEFCIFLGVTLADRRYYLLAHCLQHNNDQRERTAFPTADRTTD
ncbi:hypothetical protein C482_10142 [Natrialba chahannaoensis JCM 10990]|uniref:Uncharacterized protein n=1 Tax=Natrialba chahannaoensis JCM 10990 TaxID=1227492 RepID=M0AR29_9EURY|nr:hypothetical protein C482_10142 [Natrialba chahannaoensis JCM 10990]